MDTGKTLLKLLVTFLSMQFIFLSDANAYLDPATGSMIFQAIIAAVVGVAAVTKLYWYRLKALFCRKSSKPFAEESNAKTGHDKT